MVLQAAAIACRDCRAESGGDGVLGDGRYFGTGVWNCGAGRCALCAADASGAGHREVRRGAILLWAVQHAGGSGGSCAGTAGDRGVGLRHYKGSSLGWSA